MSIDSTPLFEQRVKEVICEMCSDVKPSRKVIDAIMQYAATYELLS